MDRDILSWFVSTWLLHPTRPSSHVIFVVLLPLVSPSFVLLPFPVLLLPPAGCLFPKSEPYLSGQKGNGPFSAKSCPGTFWKLKITISKIKIAILELTLAILTLKLAILKRKLSMLKLKIGQFGPTNGPVQAKIYHFEGKTDHFGAKIDHFATKTAVPQHCDGFRRQNVQNESRIFLMNS